MDLLSQYKQQNSDAFQEQKKQRQMTDEYGREYSGMAALIIKLSGGMIKDAQQANYPLAIATAIIALLSLVIYFTGSGGSNPSSPPTPFQLKGNNALHK